MSAAIVGSAIVVAIIVIVLVVMYLRAAHRSRREGVTGFVQKSRLECPKCHEVFDYTWIPGAALTAVRLGNTRYMACPLCHRWSMFNIWDAPAPPPRTTQ